MVRRVDAGQAEVADLDVAVVVDQDVGRFQIAMDHIGTVDGLKPSDYLIDKILDMLVQHHLRVDELMQIGGHKFLHQVHFMESVETSRPENIVETNNVLVLAEEV